MAKLDFSSASRVDRRGVDDKYPCVIDVFDIEAADGTGTDNLLRRIESG
jgi:hypothetical protein